jgi:hypothetical protein
MYIRNVKQILRGAEPSFDERKYGNLVELLRAVQREGLVRLDRDRQGVMRVFQGLQLRVTAVSPDGLPVEDPAIEHEIAMASRRAQLEQAEQEAQSSGEGAPAESAPADVEATPAASAEVSADVAQIDEEPGGSQTEMIPELAAAKPRRRKKAADAVTPEKAPAARKPRAKATTTRKRKDKVSE